MTDRCPITWTPWRHQSSLVMTPNLYEVLLSLINTRPHQSNLSARGDRKIKRTKAGLTEETSSGGEIRKMGSRFGEFWDLIGPQSSDLIGLISDLRIWSDCSRLISVGQSAEHKMTMSAEHKMTMITLNQIRRVKSLCKALQSAPYDLIYQLFLLTNFLTYTFWSLARLGFWEVFFVGYSWTH